MKPLLHQPDGKQVKILCGVSGSGKTTYAKQLTADFMRVDERLFSIVSADNYFLDEKGDYQFKASELSKAYGAFCVSVD